MPESHIRPQRAGAPAHDEPPAAHRNALLDGGVAVAVAAARPGSRAARGALVAGPAQNASTSASTLVWMINREPSRATSSMTSRQITRAVDKASISPLIRSVGDTRADTGVVLPPMSW